MDRCLFSILVVSLNAGAKLKQTIESIREQSFEDYEVIIKDGGSTDHSIDEIRNQKNLRIYISPDKGIYDGMNQAAKKAKGTYLLFLNCGDLFYSREVLRELAEGIRKKENALIYYGDIYDVLRGSPVASNPRLNDFACYRNVPCHQACIYHHSLFLERGYKTEYRVRADYEHFLWCCFEKKASPCYLPVVVASYEGGGFSERDENRRISAKEHREITAKYMGKEKSFYYRMLLLLSLAPLRTRIAEDKRLGGLYNRWKDWIYQKRGE